MPSSTLIPAPAALHLRAEGISHAYAALPVLTDVSLTVPAGVPTGLLGENGSGKSTLLRLLAGVEAPDRGTVTAPGPIGLLHQQAPFAPEATVSAVVADALDHARRLEAELAAAAEDLAERPDSAQAARAYEEVLDRATLADIWDAPRRAERILAGLGLGDLPRDRRLDAISGGQRERLALAHLLITRPTTLLLDEPTNHLDADGAQFLATLLAEHPGPVLVASHDRAFLDEATRAQIDLDDAPGPLDGPAPGATTYTGTFTDYLLARLDARERWEHRFRDEQEELAALRLQEKESHSVGHEGRGPRTEARASKKFYADRTATVVSRRVRDAQKRLETLTREQVRKPPQELHFTGIPAGREPMAGVLVTAREVAVDGRLAPVSLALSAGEKLLITGENGAGKSTLLDVLIGRLAPDAGTVSRPRALRIAHLAQDEQADPTTTPRALLRAAAGTAADDASTPELFGLIHPRDLDRRLGELSRGQVRRVELAALLSDPPELLVLDEPTNHLALDVATRLERALQDGQGTAVIASHDRWLRRRWTGRVLDLTAL